MIKLDFTKVREFGDATAGYAVKFTGDFTVLEFLTEYLPTQKEWGYVSINYEFFIDHKYILLEYSYANCGNINADLFNRVKNKVVKQIKASGGWSRMDYVLCVDDELENI